MHKPKQTTRKVNTRKSKETHETEIFVIKPIHGSIVYFTSEYTSRPNIIDILDTNILDTNFYPCGGWTIEQRCLWRDPTINFEPNNRSKLQQKKQQASIWPEFLLRCSKLCTSRRQWAIALFTSEYRKNLDRIFIVDWNKVSDCMALKIAEASRIRCQKLLFMIVLYASPYRIRGRRYSRRLCKLPFAVMATEKLVYWMSLPRWIQSRPVTETKKIDA